MEKLNDNPLDVYYAEPIRSDLNSSKFYSLVPMRN